MSAAWAIVAAGILAPTTARAANCENYTPAGQQCSRTVFFGWGTAGMTTQSVISFLSRPAASGPISFQITQVNSSLGSSYSGYFGITISANGAPPATMTASQIPPVVVQPGALSQVLVTQTCFDVTCTSNPPAAFTGPSVPNMFSMQLTITANSGADLDVTPLPLLTIQFLNNGQVGFQEQEQAIDVTAIGNSARASVNEGAADFGRYFSSGGALIEPYTSFSVTNPSSTASLTVTVNLYDFSGDLLASIPLPALPTLAAAGYLLVGRNATDTLGLLPYDTLLPSADGETFHGVYGVVGTSSGAPAPVVFLSQEFYGTSMLNAYIIH